MKWALPERTKNRHSNLVHLVPLERLNKGDMRAYCGYDCKGRSQKPAGAEDCVVCIDIARNKDIEIV